MIAALPLLAWSAHNMRVHGFFGISDYVGAVLYDGWIYYGENIGIMILDRESKAILEIYEVLPILERDKQQPTSWAVYDALLEQRYTSVEVFFLLTQASFDSIRRHPDRALKVLLLKLHNAPIPLVTLPVKLADDNPYAELTAEYFDAEPWLLPSRDWLQLFSRQVLQAGYGLFYAVWLGLGLLGLWLGLYRSPLLTWVSYVVLTTNALLLPILVGVASWRYLIPGIILMGPIAFAMLDTFVCFAADHSPSRCESSPPAGA